MGKVTENVTGNALDEVTARDWLNALIAKMEERKTLDILNSQVRAIYTDDYIQLYAGIEILAGLLGLELLLEEKTDEYYRYYFMYEGVKFLQLSDERMVCHERV